MMNAISTVSTLPLILVVDDDESLRGLTRSFLTRTGYRVIEAANGIEALARYEQDRPDLVLLDAMMPQLDGFETCIRLRQDFDAPHLPIILITALRDETSIERAFQVGATDYVTKPVHWPVLLRRVGRILELSQAEKELQHERDFARQVMNTLGQGVGVTNLELGYEYVNAAYAGMLGVSPQALLGRSHRNFTFPEDASILARFEEQWKNGDIAHLETRLRHTDGSVVYVLVTASPRWEDGKLVGGIFAVTDLTHRRRAEQQLQESEERYRVVVAALEEGIVLQDSKGHILTANKSAERILGLTEDQLRGLTSLDPQWSAIHEDGSPFPGETHPVFLSLQTGQPQSGVIMGIQKVGGELGWLSVNSQALFRPDQTEPYAAVASFTDITDRRQAEHKLSRQAFYDALTGLPNRLLFQERLEHSLAQARRRSEMLVVGLIDLDGFKAVNDKAGHAVGDQLLIEVARRLRLALREEDTVARLGGDEFTFLLPGPSGPEVALQIGQQLRQCLASTYEIGGEYWYVTASVGLSLYQPLESSEVERNRKITRYEMLQLAPQTVRQDQSETAARLLKEADRAMYEAKGEGKNGCRLYRSAQMVFNS